MTATDLVGWLGAVGGLGWIALLAVPWQPWHTQERMSAIPIVPDLDLSHVQVLIPARNEVEVIGQTLASLKEQGRDLAVMVIDDRSDDGTAKMARIAAHAVDLAGLAVIDGEPLPEGWSGKLWALQQGRRQASWPIFLLLDADIGVAPGALAALLEKRRADGCALVSAMASLRMVGFWEKLLIPAVIYFFKLLYPFRLSNGPGTMIAAGAGCCMLVDAETLDGIGGLGAVRGALIDDCALARAIKQTGARTWIGLSHDVSSHRDYAGLAPIWNMVARTAYTQLRQSRLMLAACTVVMALVFWAPLVALAAWRGFPASLALLGLVAMVVSYLPVLRFYRRSPFWALALPVIGTLYLAITWTSAIRAWRGERSRWKGRVYEA